MPGQTFVQGSQPVEYVEESTFAQTPTDPDMSWFGMITSHSVTQEVISANIRYLPEDGASNKLETVHNEKVSEAYEAELTYHPQNFNVFQYFTGAAGTTSDSMSSVTIGEQDENNSEYRRILGATGEELSLTVSEDSAAECTATFLGADSTDWNQYDYINSDASSGGADGTEGSHATNPGTDPIAYDDLTAIALGGTQIGDAVEELVLTVTNELVVVKDPTNNSRNSQIDALTPVTREIVVELSLTYDDMSMASQIRSYSPQDLTFTLNGTNFTVSDVQFPEFPYEMTPEDMVGDTISSDPCSGLTWS